MSDRPCATERENELRSKLPNPTIHVTTHDASTGKAVIRSSSQHEWTFQGHAFGKSVVYTTTGLPVKMTGDADIAAHQKVSQTVEHGLTYPDGTICQIVDFGPAAHAFMHRTHTLDFGVVLEGTIEMHLDDGFITILNKGDIAVQRGTIHEWKPHHKDEWVRMLFVMQAAEPITVAGQRLEECYG
ncbi:uncharacterized protein A1O9_12732 [Exophiala aquamarina CBS 119918]|uniref:Cupin 2 conserved barrel domain-containing protein n=1 Tax=Exophiala aquamarina CBS 119918 TaxID=1182545 RepID=A0A072NTP2_9EURO|nr:uncharacterized protein A1O9_12732 [Exophiala aquamarina CBS 119918]KEF51229.1 hypothetical protein A1O9_12732 [Exophiala aquamarina CBS 119918]